MSYHEFPYGPKLDEYLSLRKLGVGVSRHETEASSECKIEDAIDSLSDPKSVNCGTFETILTMERSPECAYLHLLLSDVGVFPSCVRLLRMYCKEGRGILDHAYGFLCLQVMALSVEVAKLNQVEQLDVVLERLNQISTEVSPSDLLNQCSRDCESDEFCKEEYLRPSPRLLGWHTDPDTRLETCLACIGGCNIQDVLFLLDQLWPARSSFLQASECAANSFPGWCGLFYVMHGTLVKAFGNFAYRRGTPEEKIHWIHLLELMMRYVLCSQRSEDITLARLLRDCPQFAESYETTVTMPLDCDRLVKAYSNKMGKLPTFVYGYATRLYGFVCKNYHVNTARSNEHLNTICASSLEESWAELLRANLLSAGQWYQFTNTIVTNTTLLMTSANHQVNKPILLAILTNEDFFDFLGRLFLFPMSVEGESIGRDRHLEWEAHSLKGLSAFGGLIRSHLANRSFEPSPKLILSWDKTQLCFQFQKNMSTSEVRYKQEYAKTWGNAWLRVGVELELARPMESEGRCFYSRCAAPHSRGLSMCPGCKVYHFCSSRCYQADWVDPQNTHRTICGMV